jgi:hypothetical protein
LKKREQTVYYCVLGISRSAIEEAVWRRLRAKIVDYFQQKLNELRDKNPGFYVL